MLERASMRGKAGNSLKVAGPGLVMLFGAGTTSNGTLLLAMVVTGALATDMSRAKIPRTGSPPLPPSPPSPPTGARARARETSKPASMILGGGAEEGGGG